MEEDFYAHRRRSNVTFLFLTILNIILLAVHLSKYVEKLKNFTLYIISPAPSIASRITQSGQNIFQNLQEIVEVHEENIILKKKLEKYYFLEKEYQQSIEENKRLRQIIDFPVQREIKQIAARVIIREPEGWFQWVIINKGAKEGIYVDAPVLAIADNKLSVFGRVSEVFNDSAKIVLITNILSSIPAKMLLSDEDGLIEGENNSKLKINYLLAETKISIGDEVVTSPISSVFPPGISIGYIQDMVALNDNEIFRSAIVKPTINFNSLKEVIVLVPKKKVE